MRVPRNRIRELNQCSVRPEGEYVLYWMTAARRTTWNFALDHALDWSVALQRPLLILEPLRCGYEWASVRLHQFVLDGMRDNAEACARAGIRYFPYVERSDGEGRGLLASLSERACLVVADDSPAFFQPRMLEAAARSVSCALVGVDGNGLLPIRTVGVAYNTAYAFRRMLQAELPQQLRYSPAPNGLSEYACGSGVIDSRILERWPAVSLAELHAPGPLLAALPIDQSVAVAPSTGGPVAAAVRMNAFLEHGVGKYHSEGNGFAPHASSGLSPYLHFGHVSPHAILFALAQAEDWNVDQLAENTLGRKEGWWGLPAGTESYLDELVTWRELAFNTALHMEDYRSYQSLPDWALRTLDRHRGDARPMVYDVDQLAAARTYDPIWNAAQRQLVRDGTIHRYLRMLWGKKILEWSETPERAWTAAVELNNRYALDGRDPNSYAGIAWVFGRYDRPWPERPVFGTVRSMTSKSTARKMKLAPYLEKYGESPYVARIDDLAASAR